MGLSQTFFRDVDDLDARDAGRNVEVFLDVRIEGKPTPVTVKLSYEQASDLAILLEPLQKARSLLPHPVKQRANIFFDYAPILVFASLNFFVVDRCRAALAREQD